MPAFVHFALHNLWITEGMEYLIFIELIVYWLSIESIFISLSCLDKYVTVFSLAGGSLFLFDRKVLRYFRKDGHNWRKKKDGKTVKEAHEKLKVKLGWFILLMIDRKYTIYKIYACVMVSILIDLSITFLQCGSIDMLHCYYAHGEENENFQRRSYWLLEECVT